MKNIGQMMKQAQEMQRKMSEMQDKLAEAEVQGSSGGGMVTVILNGKAEMKAIKIDPSLIDPEDKEVLEDLIVAGFNDAKAKVEAHIAEQMEQITGGMQLPDGFNLPM